MKKINKYISFAMSALLATSFVACSKNDKNNTSNAENSTAKIENGYRVELATFEKSTKDYSLIKLLEDFGKITRNQNAEYAKGGNGSVKLQPIGSMYLGVNPSFYYPFTSEFYDLNYEDFTNVDYISFWMYNDNEEDKALRVGLVSTVKGVNNVTKMPSQTFYLKPKSWNLVKYYIDFNTMNITQEITELMITSVKGVYFEFNRSASEKMEDAPVYYLDDINLYYKDTANTVSDASQLITFDADEESGVYELCDFEKVYQKYIFAPNSTKSLCLPQISVVNAESEGIVATSGTSVMKAILPAGDTVNGSYPRLDLSRNVIRKFYDQFVYDYDTKKPIIPIEDWDKYRIAYDVYYVGEERETFDLVNQFYSLYNGQFSWYTRAVTTTRMKANEWTTYSWSLAELSDKRNSRLDMTRNEAGQLIPVEGPVKVAYEDYAANFDKNGGAGQRITDAGEIYLTYGEFTGEDKVIYIDNLRVYKV